jgi:hypothetical protein
MPMETTTSSAYRLARYTIIPEVLKAAEQCGDEPFLLREISHPIILQHVPPEAREAEIISRDAGNRSTFLAEVKWYVSYQIKEQGLLVNLGRGMFRNSTADDIREGELETSAIEDGDSDACEFDGWVYAFSFPSVKKEGVPFPIKVGMTAGDVDARVTDQCKGSATFENPEVLGRWQVKRVGHFERAVQNVLKARGRWRENAPGVEWFDTTIAEITSVIEFVKAA